MEDPFFGYDPTQDFLNTPELEDRPSVPEVSDANYLQDLGNDPFVQVFYEGPEKCDCCVNWVERRPPEIPEAEKNKYDRAAIKVYRRKNHDEDLARHGGLITYKVDKIVIQSRILIDSISVVLKAKGVRVPKEGSLEVSAPFQDLYFAYDDIVALKNTTDYRNDARGFLECLVKVIEPLFAETATKVKRLGSKGCTDYSTIWTLFPKASIAYRKLGHRDTLIEIVGTAPHLHAFRGVGEARQKRHEQEVGTIIRFRYIIFDGSNFGVVRDHAMVEVFAGDRLVTELPIYPVSYHGQTQSLLMKLSARGTRILYLQDVLHCYFEGSATEALEKKTTFLSGRVVVDQFRFSTQYPEDCPLTEPLERPLDYLETHEGASGSLDSPVSEKPWLKRIDEDAQRRPTPAERSANLEFFKKNPKYLAFVHPFVYGFSLKHNKWFELDLARMRHIRWPENPLAQLVFDKGIKDMLHAFARHHARLQKKDDSVAEGKGSGLVVLLSGPPGTGKTLTAEAVAEVTKAPLYRIVAGELGTQPASVEHRLTELLDLALEWKCVVLLDEADTFIQRRSETDRTGSEIVSIFLRQLEYFKGIIFLTTNMPESIDSAIESRCRLHVRFPALDLSSRAEVWKLNFQKLGLIDLNRHSVSESQIRLKLSQAEEQYLFSWQLSGRVIQNVVRNAVLWCTAEGGDVTISMLETSIKMTAPLSTRDVQDGEMLMG